MIRLVEWLANEGSVWAGGLKAGQFVTCGSWTGKTPGAGRRFGARRASQGLGEASARSAVDGRGAGPSRMNLADLPTPCLVLDRPHPAAQPRCAWQRALARHGVALRPHMKTAKSIDVARLAMRRRPARRRHHRLHPRGSGVFRRPRHRRHPLAVGITPQKLDQVAKLNAAGAEIMVVTDDAETAGAIAAPCRRRRAR